ncbi:MAG: TIGR03619 family F420-dependent LLM class oxidoreductase [Nitriliruptorales bacterium]|nr:TIGR03619 family F420-dependent LLM class oxidoreductase [Nitriliruptorales bacterium]
MQIGVVFPQLDMGADREAIRAYAQGVEDLGFEHVLAYDHVLGADPEVHEGWSGTYSISDTFHEPLVLFGFLAGIVGLELVTGIIILPQRQTALVAKQAAEVDILSGGRLRFGVGLGWNAVEYEALGMDFSDRGRRVEEQVDLLRRLWTEPTLSFSGNDHRITGAGIAPLPLQCPIPIWIGATSSARALRRVGRLADGWLAMGKPGPELAEAADTIRQAATDAGRDPAQLGIDGRIDVGKGDLQRIAAEAAGWRDLGATHLSLNTMRAGLKTVDDHLGALSQALGAVRG